MNKIKMKAMAKVNLGLDVLRRRADGYHDVKMIMQTIDLCDQVEISRTDTPGIEIRTNLQDLPTNSDNLVYKAAELILKEAKAAEKIREKGICISLEKHIPVAAGLAGGSTDAAAVLKGLNEMFELGFSVEELMVLGKKIGADVPYCIKGGTMLAEGIGEKLTGLPDVPKCTVLLVKPQVQVSTAFVYKNLKLDDAAIHPDIDGQIQAIRDKNLYAMSEKMGNILESVTIPAFPQIQEIKEKMLSCGAVNAMMSGSGPTVFGIFDDPKKAEAAREQTEKMENILISVVTEFVNL